MGNNQSPTSQLSLFNGNTSNDPPDSGLEARLTRGRFVPTRFSPANTLEDYGITYKNLSPFLSAPPARPDFRANNYYFLQSVWAGILNIESLDGRYGMQHELYVNLHPAEILAALSKASKLKRMDAAMSEGYKPFRDLERLGSDDVGEFFHEALNQSLKHIHGIRILYNQFGNMHANGIVDRVNAVPVGVRLRFLDSLRLPYRRSDMKTREFQYTRRDPHPENQVDYTGINIYRIAISDLMELVYRQNLRRFQKTA